MLGAEVCDLLSALNTGHKGGAGTVHANSVLEVPARSEALASLGGVPRDVLHGQLAAAMQILVHMRRDRPGVRRLDRRAGQDAGRPAGAAGVARPAYERRG